jgi:hypothetical protein
MNVHYSTGVFVMLPQKKIDFFAGESMWWRVYVWFRCGNNVTTNDKKPDFLAKNTLPRLQRTQELAH